MKKIPAIIIMATLVACNGAEHKTTKEQAITIIGKPDVKIENRHLTPEVLWAMGRVGNTCVSPDGKRIAFTVTYYSISENRGNADIYVMDADGSNRRQLTKTVKGEAALTWLKSGLIAFLREGKLWNIDPDSGAETQVSAIEQSIDGFIYSPDELKALLVIPTKLDNYAGKERYKDLDKANALIYDELMYRHWNEWKDGNYNHIYIATLKDGKISDAEDIMPGEPYDSPTKPFGGTEEIAWSPDGKTIVYTCKKLKGKEYAFSTNTDLYAYSLADKSVKNLTPDMPGYDKYPQFSPDGSMLLFTSMKRAGYEADKERIMLMNLATGVIKDVSEALDASPASLLWSNDGTTIYLSAPDKEAHQIFKLNPANGEFTKLTDGNVDYQNIRLAGNSLIATRTQHIKPAEIFSINPSTGEAKELSFVNKELLEKIDIPTVEKRFVTTTDNKQMVTWVVYPPNFDKSKKYPLILICTGGPQGVLGPSFSYRWNYMLMASQGYVVVAPARRGTSGSGQEWCDAISKNHGEQEERDLLAAIDAVAKEPWADENRIGAAGASYGGYSIFHLAGTHKGKFKAFLAHCGIFNMEMMYVTTEEMFFEQWETGGAPWEENNAAAQRSFSHSPHLLVKNWNTPIMIVHGEHDYRVPYSQGMAAYNAAQMLGVESRLLIFPTETHWVLSPQNAIVWQREFFGWFDKYLK
ncbi:MAG: S9 family peptidase [Tannerella sp.]|jgi:dipeptidyl aminopeptidase/acylaminoacyl peptidase|nr:S9 family peptidase [Tannerella sp.]